MISPKKKYIYILGSLVSEVKILKITKLINQELYSVFCKILWVDILESSLHATSYVNSFSNSSERCQIRLYPTPLLLNFALLIVPLELA